MSKSEDSHFYGDAKQGMMRLLQRLNHNSRANLPSLMAQRGMSSFTLHEEPLPEQAVCNVGLLVYPQNPMIDEPEVRYLHSDDAQEGLINSRVRIEDSTGLTVKPDEDGNYFHWSDKPEFALVNAFYYTTFTLRMFERYTRRAISWAFPSARLTIDPHVGNLSNAFYNEQARMIGFHTYTTVEGKVVSTAENADIVSHETAHAVLDGMRDFWNESFGLGCRGFHESFGDIAAVLVALHDDTLIRRLLSWTNNDLRVSNFVSQVAEHLVEALQKGEVSTPEHTIYLRNALNAFTYQPFDVLEYLPTDPEMTLSRQEHNYSRLFTGACYDALVGMYEAYGKEHSPYMAVIKARDTLGYLVMMAIELAPVGEMDFADMAKAFLSADSIGYEGEFEEMLIHVFAKRDILSEADARKHLKALKNLPDIRLPKTLTNALSSALFLEQTVFPALSLKIDEELLPMGTYRNADGYAFMTYFSVRSLELNDTVYRNFEGASIDIFGGLTLAFDEKDRLRSVVYRPVTEEDIRQIRIIVAELIRYERISTILHPNDEAPSPTPKGLYIQSLPQVIQAKIVKYPTVFDTIPSGMSSFLDHLLRWKKRMS